MRGWKPQGYSVGSALRFRVQAAAVVLAVEAELAGELYAPLVAVALLEVAGEPFYAVFPGQGLPYRVNALRVLVRGHGERGGEVIAAEALGLPRGEVQPQLEALRAPRAALGLILKPAHGLVVGPAVVSAGDERDARYALEHAKLVLKPQVILRAGLDIGVIIAEEDLEVPRQIFEHIARAGPAAAVQQKPRPPGKRGRNPIEFELVIPLHLDFAPPGL